MLKFMFGLVLAVFAVLLGIYVGLWLMFIGGIEQIVDAVQVEPADGSGIAWGIVRIVFSGFVGWLSFLVLFIPGIALMDD